MDLFIMLFVNVLLKSLLILCHRLDLSGFSFGLEVTRIETFFFCPISELSSNAAKAGNLLTFP